MYFYAVLDNKKVTQIKQVVSPIDSADHISIPIYDVSLLDKEYDGLNFIDPVVEKTLENLRAEKHKLRLAKRKEDFDALMSEYDPFEYKTFDARKDEAKLWMQDNTVSTDNIDASLPSGYTEQERTDEINAVYQKSLAISAQSGISRDLRNAIDKATTIAELEAIEV